MPRRDIEFKTTDGVVLRGWFYPPAGTSKAPCLVMAHGWSALKEMDLDAFAEYFTSKLNISCLVYDNRKFGASDGEPRHEIIPSQQQSDYSDAITYAQTLGEVDAEKIGIWGTSYSGGHVLVVGAVDRRVKAVLSQVPAVSPWESVKRFMPSEFIDSMDQMFQADRLARMAGKEPGRLPVVQADLSNTSTLPADTSYQYFAKWQRQCNWKNDVTVRSFELMRGNEPSHLIHHIAPTPLLMTLAENDVNAHTDIALEAYSRAREPKQLQMIPGGHFDGYTGPNFEGNAGCQVEFLKQYLCS